MTKSRKASDAVEAFDEDALFLTEMARSSSKALRGSSLPNSWKIVCEKVREIGCCKNKEGMLDLK